MKKIFILAALLCPLAHAQTTINCITTPGTYNYSSTASWIGGVVPVAPARMACGTSGVNIFMDVNTTIGDSPTATTNVITFSGGAVLKFGPNVTVTARGGVSKGAGTYAANGNLMFDSTGAASPTSTAYTLTEIPPATWAFDGTNPPTSTTRFTINANPAGTNFLWKNSTGGSGISVAGNMLVQYCGDPGGATPCVAYLPGGSHGTLQMGGVGAPMVFDHTCGIDWLGTGETSADSWVFQDVSTENSYGTCPSWTANTGLNVPSGTRSWDTFSFDNKPSFETHGATYNNGIFLKGYAEPTGFVSATNYAIISNSVIVVSFQSASTPLEWNDTDNVLAISDILLTNDVIIGDPTTTFVSGTATAQTPYVTGTATSATASTLTSTLTDTTKSMTPHVYQANQSPSFALYMLCVTAGTGSTFSSTGECLSVADNSATGWTLSEKWPITPDATSVYKLYAGQFNGHWTNGQSLPIGVTEPAFSGDIWGLATGGDSQGDGYHAWNSVGGTTCNQWRGAWSSATTYTSLMAVSQAGLYYRSTATTTNNDPSTDGGAHWTLSTLAGLDSGCGVHQIVGNIFLASATRDNSMTVLTGGNAFYVLDHLSYFTGAQSAAFDESRPAAFPGQFLKLENSIAWADPAKTYVLSSLTNQSGLGPYVLQDSGSPSVATGIYIHPDAQNCGVGGTSTCMDYNGEYGLLTTGYCASVSGDNQGGSTGYNDRCDAPLGTNDVVGNPGFLNPFASPQTWIQSLGIDTSIHDPVAIMPEVYACLAKVNDPTGFNSSCTVANLYNYEHNAMNFTNPAFHNAGADGLDLGAGQYQPPVVPNFNSTNTRWSGTVVIQ